MFFLVLLAWVLVGALLCFVHPFVGVAVLSLGCTAVVVWSIIASLYKGLTSTLQAVPAAVSRPIRASVEATGNAVKYTRNLLFIAVILLLVALWLAFIIHAFVWEDAAKGSSPPSASLSVAPVPAAAKPEGQDQRLLTCLIDGREAGASTLPSNSQAQAEGARRAAGKSPDEALKACARRVRAQD